MTIKYGNTDYFDVLQSLLIHFIEQQTRLFRYFAVVNGESGILAVVKGQQRKGYKYGSRSIFACEAN